MQKPTYFINHGISKDEILNRMEKTVLAAFFIKEGPNRQKLTIYQDQVLKYFSQELNGRIWYILGLDLYEFVIFELYARSHWCYQYALQIALVTVAYYQKADFD